MNNTETPNAREPRLAHRTDIQGLRAIAILLVVAAHAKIAGLAGGFIGVDVFYVLSGYLITGLLTQELAASSTIGFRHFYARRFLRLLPALLAMLLVSCVAAVIILLPGAQHSQASAAATASVWLSNFYFAFSNIDYFGPVAENNIFLHTWSLGVEEQFYLAWPTLLAFIAALPSSSVTQRLARIKVAMLVIAAISLAFCIASTPHAPELAFYMMPWRAWQFALGALVMLHWNASSGPQRSTWMGWLGLGLVLGSAVCLRPDFAYPGAWALIPSIGAACILAAGAQGMNTGAGALLSLRPMQYFGRVSYSWYLWHWPVLLLGAALINSGHLANRLLLVAVSLGLAELSYRLVESPIRKNRKLIARPSATIFLAIVLTLLAAVLAVRWNNAISKWLNQPEQQHYNRVRLDAPSIYSYGCDDWYHSADVKFCQFGKDDAKHTAVIMGDSIGLQWFPAVATVFDDMGWRLLAVTKSSCPIVEQPYFYARIGREYTECSEWREKALDQIRKMKPEVLIIGSSISPTFSNEQWTEGTKRVLAKVSPLVNRVYILRATPAMPFNGPDCLSGKNWRPRQLLFSSSCSASSIDPRADEIFAALSLAAQSYKNVSMLDMNESVCPGHQCSAERENQVVFRDNQHMTGSFAESLSPQFKAQLNLGASASEQKTPN